MGFDFLHNNGARRIRNYGEQPFLLTDNAPQDTELDDETVELTYETGSLDGWEPINIESSQVPKDWPFRPKRFVDGKDNGRTIAWLQGRHGYPVPVRLSQVGAVAMRNDGGQLRREFAIVDQVVSLAADLFPWDEVEDFARALKGAGLRLLICQPSAQGWSYDFERMRISTQNRSMDEMTRFERHALAQDNRIPTIIDGLLGTRASAFDHEESPVVGLIKTLRNIQLHEHGWQVLYSLQPGQRTPAFRMQTKRLSVVSWYLRIDGANGELPNYGIVRLEIPAPFFEDKLGGQAWDHINHLSQLVSDYRCKDSSYKRASVSIYPIQRAEESLGSLFSNADSLINHFYRLTNL